jgi:phosphoribosylformylglycinamidine synthase
MKFGIVVFPGTNCDRDCFHVVTSVLGQEAVYLWHKSTDLSGCDALILPGGFSYGDYLRAGAIGKFSPVMQSVIGFAKSGGPVIGICNGFQILVESGLLPGAFIRNRTLKFVCRTVHIKVENTTGPFTGLLRAGEILSMPVAHGDGSYFADRETLNRLESENRILFKYCDPAGTVTDEANPNGSVENIAGIVSPEGNVLGMMPHPERALESILGSTDGAKIFNSLIQSFTGVTR